MFDSVKIGLEFNSKIGSTEQLTITAKCYSCGNPLKIQMASRSEIEVEPCECVWKRQRMMVMQMDEERG